MVVYWYTPHKNRMLQNVYLAASLGYKGYCKLGACIHMSNVLVFAHFPFSLFPRFWDTEFRGLSPHNDIQISGKMGKLGKFLQNIEWCMENYIFTRLSLMTVRQGSIQCHNITVQYSIFLCCVKRTGAVGTNDLK